ncbi:hypothetical protein SNEBB_005658 [Seison nebaliae]|nr:hypothetical protein SNEBB_005658 [Seison nebaliae]
MDKTKYPVQIPNEYVSYAEKHRLFDTIEQLLRQLLINRPENPLRYMVDLLRNNKHVPKIIILGPPLSGKNTIAKMLIDEFNVVRIDSSSLPDKRLNSGANLRFIKTRVEQSDVTNRGFILVGYPRTRNEALSLQNSGFQYEHIILLDSTDQELLERAKGMRLDPVTEDVYHMTFNTPNSEEVMERLVIPNDNDDNTLLDRFTLYHCNITGIIEAFRSAIRCIDVNRPIIDVFKQSVRFVKTEPRSNAPRTVRIIIVGPPGAGKRTLASHISEHYGLVPVNLEYLIEQAIASKTSLGLACEPFINDDIQIPDHIVLQIIKNRLNELDCRSKGWVLTGYPKNKSQAEQLELAGYVPSNVIVMELPIDAIMERLSLKYTEQNTGEQYHLLFEPPPKPIQDSILSLRRHPENEPIVIQEKVNLYQMYLEELLTYYRTADKELVSIVNADDSFRQVFQRVESIIIKAPRQNQNQ